MPGVRTITVGAEEGELRLDRWFRRHFPELSHGRLEKLLRTGQVRIDGRRARAGQRLEAGQKVRVPPLPDTRARSPKPGFHVVERDMDDLRARVLYRDDEIIAVNKPAGLAVQGGSGTFRHLDAMLDGLRFDALERPRLVHRLDRDTSGVLLLARSAGVARRLGHAFRARETRKVYWALVAGVPKPRDGRIDLRLAKHARRGVEKMTGDEGGRRAVTLYRTLDALGKKCAWVALMPVTGRTHQLRVHMAAIGTPILGDGKYGGRDAFLPGRSLAPKLHLHAREIDLPLPGGGRLAITAPLPPHMAEAFRFFGFDPEAAGNPFAEEAPG